MTSPLQGSTVEEQLQANNQNLLRAILQLVPNAPPQQPVNPFSVAGTLTGPVGPQLFPGLAPHRGPVSPLPQWQMPQMPYSPVGLQDCSGVGAPGWIGPAPMMMMPSSSSVLTPPGQAPVAPAFANWPPLPPFPFPERGIPRATGTFGESARALAARRSDVR